LKSTYNKCLTLKFNYYANKTPNLAENQFLITFFFLLSCQKEEATSIKEHNHGIEQKYSKSNIDFDTFKMKFLDRYENQIADHFSPLGNKGGDDYIVEVNTDRIIEFTNDSISTYTFNVVTSDQDYESFTNLIYFERDNQVGEVIFKYSPTEEWINELANGNKAPFSGTLSLMSTEGEVIQADEVIDGVPQGKVAPCLFSAIPIWVDCYGASCPCPDGNGYLGGWDITVSCGPAGGGGSGGNGGTGGGGGPGGGGGSPYGGGDLPTDPLEWNLFFDLKGIMGENDSFYLDHTLTPHPDLIFDTFEDFEAAINGFEVDNSEVIEIQDGTYNTMWTLSTSVFPDIQFIINSTLCDNGTGQQYQLNRIDAFLIGNQYVECFLELNAFYYHGVNTNNRAEIELFFDFGVDTQVGNFPFHISVSKHYMIEIDIYSGWLMNDIELD
jgi:hypothetical protein